MEIQIINSVESFFKTKTIIDKKQKIYKLLELKNNIKLKNFVHGKTYLCETEKYTHKYPSKIFENNHVEAIKKINLFDKLNKYTFNFEQIIYCKSDKDDKLYRCVIYEYIDKYYPIKMFIQCEQRLKMLFPDIIKIINNLKKFVLDTMKNNIIYRNINDSNIFINIDSGIKIIGFENTIEMKNAKYSQVGDEHYQAPEIKNGMNRINNVDIKYYHASELYSIGILGMQLINKDLEAKNLFDLKYLGSKIDIVINENNYKLTECEEKKEIEKYLNFDYTKRYKMLNKDFKDNK